MTGALVEFRPSAMRGWRASFRRPGRRDYAYLATKTFGFNLAVRAAFACSAVAGGVSWPRAAASLSWYQFQDAVFTLFGESYLNLLSRAHGVLSVGGWEIGDLAFVYAQLCASELLTRLLLGPAGDTPSVLTAAGLGLVFVNVAQGMLAGGAIAPAIGKARRAGLFGERFAVHAYQISGLTIHLGLLASFGHQVLYAWATGLLSILSWSFYLGLTVLPKPAVVAERA